MRQENARAQVAMPGDAKIRNRQMMLRAICSGQAVTAADIHQSTGISRLTAMRFLQHLCQCGAVAPVGFGESTRAGGKKPELFRFSDQRRILCVNLWPETIALALSGLAGPVYDLEESARPPAWTAIWPGRRPWPRRSWPGAVFRWRGCTAWCLPCPARWITPPRAGRES